MSSRSRQDLEAWLKTLDVRGKVLDVGGSQKPVKGRTQSWAVDTYEILDIPFPHETEQEPDYTEWIDAGGYLRVPHNHYDTIFCLEVMEYVTNPFRALENLMKLGTDNATLYITTHWLYGLHKPKEKDFLRYSREGFANIALGTGWKIKEVVPRLITPEGKRALRAFYVSEGMKISEEDINLS